MSKFNKQYKTLTDSQKQAVDNTEGPMLVIAGPGTGKTQLLSMRVANILKKNDVLPSNILCLTFTDNAARNMRERLAQIIGQPAYHVAIHTFHGFGAEIIGRYSDYFTRRQLLQQIDELGRYELLQQIFENLPHSNPLSTKVGSQFIFLKDTLSTISRLKQNALTPKELHIILQSNQKLIKATEKDLAKSFEVTPSPKQLSVYSKLLAGIKKHAENNSYFGFKDYGSLCAGELEAAIDQTDPNGRYAPKITQWRNRWCRKDATGRHVFKDSGQNYRKMQAVADVYQTLLDDMGDQGLYDFDDMVIETVHAMENNDELRLNLQEQYQYVLVDEFQDTNKAQLRMMNALGDNPIFEGKPNIMAVGDDDQAIYAFQGAEASNMAAFVDMYGVEPIVLEENFRSNASILQASSGVSGQISDRLEAFVPSMTKSLTARQKYPVDIIDHFSFSSEQAQYDWISKEAQKLIKRGLEPEKIAVIAPRHKYLERLMPYLGNLHLPVAYERRENILEAPIIQQLITMSKLIDAIADNHQDDVDVLVSQVISYDFWEIEPIKLTNLSLFCYDKHKHWLEVLSKHQDKKFKDIADWLINLAKRSKLEPMEYMLDHLIGTTVGSVDSEYDDLLLPQPKSPKFVSPMRQYYFSSNRYENSADTYLTLLGQLSTLRHRLRLWKPNKMLYIKDLVEFSDLHLNANIKIIDTNPHTQTTKALQVMTVYKAKGLEFDAVFLINAQDEVWGPTAGSQSSKISLPKNLPIEPVGDSDNDKLRMLFVGFTRARHTLYITGYTHTQENKLSPALSFLEPINLKEKIVDKPAPPEAKEILSKDWAYRFRQVIANKEALFEPILANYKLSVTHLNNFIDIKDGGPDYFFIHNLLRFPEALNPSAAYGDAIHNTIKWIHVELKQAGKIPSSSKVQSYFSDILGRKHLRQTEYKKLDKRGREALAYYLKQRPEFLSANDLIERGFNNDGVIVNNAHLSGKIDKLHFANNSSVKVIDFKTGKPAQSWKGKDEFENIKLHKYRQQLLFYKLLVENSASFKGKLSVDAGEIEFIEPDSDGNLLNNLVLKIDPQELDDFIKLVEVVWTHIMRLDFPDTSKYPKSLKGIRQFEQDLIKGKI